MNLEQPTRFAAAVAQYNRNNSDNAVKFIFLYDSNQVTAGNIGRPSIEKD